MESELEKRLNNKIPILIEKTREFIGKALSIPMGIFTYFYAIKDYMKIQIENENKIKNGYEKLIIETDFPSLKNCIASWYNF